MADEKFDVIVVGAGPAGTSAAITAAKAGLNVVLLERGEYPGSKNVQGAVLYTKNLADILPRILEGSRVSDGALHHPAECDDHRRGFRHPDRLQERQMGEGTAQLCYTIIRVNFDKWYAQQAEKAGAQVYSGVRVSPGF